MPHNTMNLNIITDSAIIFCGFILSKIFASVPPIGEIASFLSIAFVSVRFFVLWPQIKERGNNFINKFKR